MFVFFAQGETITDLLFGYNLFVGPDTATRSLGMTSCACVQPIEVSGLCRNTVAYLHRSSCRTGASRFQSCKDLVSLKFFGGSSKGLKLSLWVNLCRTGALGCKLLKVGVMSLLSVYSTQHWGSIVLTGASECY